mmetsp:Transcript_14259/g.21335  ORF Transcript_14259/g.21335 Transcript_14259/m.21335 type:complete len:207 (+) Transcript_14259:754-1374(+)
MDMDEPFRHLTQLATYQLVPRRPLVRRIMKATTIASLWIATPLRSPVRCHNVERCRIPSQMATMVIQIAVRIVIVMAKATWNLKIARKMVMKLRKRKSSMNPLREICTKHTLTVNELSVHLYQIWCLVSGVHRLQDNVFCFKCSGEGCGTMRDSIAPRPKMMFTFYQQTLHIYRMGRIRRNKLTLFVTLAWAHFWVRVWEILEAAY